MSRRRTLIRNFLKLCQKGWLPLLAVGMSANALSLSVRSDNLQGARNTMSAQLSAQRQVIGTVKTDSMAPDQVDLFKPGLNPSDTMSRYLWEGSKTSEPKLSRYLWEGSKSSDLKLSRYLWEGAKTSDLKLSRYLWEGSKTSDLKLSGYFWDGAKTPEINLSRYLWTDEKASESNPAPSAVVAMPIAAERGEYGAGFARFLWREFDTALPDTETKSGLLDDLMGHNPPAFLLDPRLQVASLTTMPSPLRRKQQVALTGLNFSAKSAATLEFEGQIVRWSLVNQGLKPLEFSTLDLTVPDGAALTSVVVKQTGLAPIDLGVESSRLSLEGALRPGGSAMVEVTFVEGPSRY